MKSQALFGLRLLLGVILFAVGSRQAGGLDLVVQHIQMIGPRQWLILMAGSIASGQHIARAFPIRSIPCLSEDIAGGTTV